MPADLMWRLSFADLGITSETITFDRMKDYMRKNGWNCGYFQAIHRYQT